MNVSWPGSNASLRDRRLREERLPAAVMFLAGLWIIGSPWMLDYATTFAGTAGFWNDVVCGAVIAVVAICCLLAPPVAARLGLVNVVLGFWLIVVPFVLEHPPEASHRDAARANEIISGIVVAIFSVVCVTIAARRMKAARRS